jgi:hypothetical protein
LVDHQFKTQGEMMLIIWNFGSGWWWNLLPMHPRVPFPLPYHPPRLGIREGVISIHNELYTKKMHIDDYSRDRFQALLIVTPNFCVFMLRVFLDQFRVDLFEIGLATSFILLFHITLMF